MGIEDSPTNRLEKIEPTYEHDCAECVFLGTDVSDRLSVEKGANQTDVYVHRNGQKPEEGTIVRRYGSKDDQYASLSLHEARALPERENGQWQRALKMLKA